MKKILNGKSIKNKILDDLKGKINNLSIKPGLAVIMIGNDQASKIYVRNKILACEKIGYYYEKFFLPETISKEKILDLLKKLNNNKKIHGIIVQYPLPKRLNYLEKEINQYINSLKDVDCFNPLNVGKMFLSKNNQENIFFPATSKGIIRLLKEYKINILGKKVVIIGRSNLVGKPLSLMFLNEGATVIIAHSQTKNLSSVTKTADILVVAIGKKHYIKKEMIKKGVVIVDVGINRENNQVYGDVDYDDVFEKVKAITPVVGGVGQMTVASLMENVFLAYQLQNQSSDQF